MADLLQVNVRSCIFNIRMSQISPPTCFMGCLREVNGTQTQFLIGEKLFCGKCKETCGKAGEVYGRSYQLMNTVLSTTAAGDGLLLVMRVWSGYGVRAKVDIKSFHPEFKASKSVKSVQLKIGVFT